MTRVKFFAASTSDELEVVVNAWIEKIEDDQSGIKCLEYRLDIEPTPPVSIIYSAMVVYGNGPSTSQRWSGRTG